MQTRIVLCVAFGICAAAMVVAADPPAKPKTAELPQPKVENKGASPAQIEALKNEIEALIREREALTKTVVEEPSSLPEKMKLKSKVLNLIEKLEVKKPIVAPMAPPKTVEPTLPNSDPKIDLSPATTESDKVRIAENHFRANNVDACYRVLNLTDFEKLTKDEKVFAKYLKACCQRRLGKTSEAKVTYREVADEKLDDFYTECALTHLQIMNDVEALEDGLKQLRTGRKKQ